MNYNIPYYGFLPTRAAAPSLRGSSGGLFGRLFKGFNLGSILNNTQRTLNIVNQTIPLIKQVNPLIKNAKTMFHVMNEFKKIDVDTKSNVSSTTSTDTKQSTNNQGKAEVSKSVNNVATSDGGPTFFVN